VRVKRDAMSKMAKKFKLKLHVLDDASLQDVAGVAITVALNASDRCCNRGEIAVVSARVSLS
jgi:hypothetical protein